MLTVTLTLDDIDYAALAERLVSMRFDALEKKENKSFRERLALLFRKPADFLAPNALKLLGEQKDSKLVICEVEKHKAAIIDGINKLAADQKVGVTLKDISVK
jgi:hypothetical protein